MLTWRGLTQSDPLSCGWGTGCPERKRALHEAYQTGRQEAGTHSGVSSGTPKPGAMFPTCEQTWQLQLEFIEHLLCTHQSSKPSGVSIPRTLSAPPGGCWLYPRAPLSTTKETEGQEVNYFPQGHRDNRGRTWVWSPGSLAPESTLCSTCCPGVLRLAKSLRLTVATECPAEVRRNGPG